MGAPKAQVNEGVSDKIVYVDVDGVIVVPDPSQEGREPFFSQYCREEDMPPGCLPTAKQSWRNIRIKVADEAAECLRFLSTGARIHFLTAHPKWSLQYLLREMKIIVPYEFVEWKSYFPHKALAVRNGMKWAWIEDGVTPDDMALLRRRRWTRRYVETDPYVGITMEHAEKALGIVTGRKRRSS